MPTGIYRGTVNGFRVRAETWDDAWEWDGKRDEVFTSVIVTTYDRDGKPVSAPSEHTSPVMGDVSGQNGRVQAGTASSMGGLRTGDTFPRGTPWIRGEIDPARDWPPCSVWSGTLTQGQNAVSIIPSLWEWDPGQHFLEGWFDWAASTAQIIGPKIKTVAGASAGAVVDAVSLGLDTAVSLFAPGSGPVGTSGSRPIGLQQSPEDRSKYTFTPQVLLLTYDTAEHLVNSEPSGRGKGVLSFRFFEHPRFRGDYDLYVQVEKVSAADDPTRPTERRSLRSLNAPEHYLRHRNFLYELTPISSQLDRADATLELVPGLVNPALVSLRAVNATNHYVRHQDFRIRLSPFSSDPQFQHDATFRMVPGLAAAGGVSFEAVNGPGLYVRHRDFHIYLEGEKPNDSSPFKQDVTFFLDPPLG